MGHTCGHLCFPPQMGIPSQCVVKWRKKTKERERKGKENKVLNHNFAQSSRYRFIWCFTILILAKMWYGPRPWQIIGHFFCGGWTLCTYTSSTLTNTNFFHSQPFFRWLSYYYLFRMLGVTVSLAFYSWLMSSAAQSYGGVRSILFVGRSFHGYMGAG